MKEKLLQILDKWGCHHEWSKIESIKIMLLDDTFLGYKNLYVCKKCGKFKFITTKV